MAYISYCGCNGQSEGFKPNVELADWLSSQVRLSDWSSWPAERYPCNVADLLPSRSDPCPGTQRYLEAHYTCNQNSGNPWTKRTDFCCWIQHELHLKLILPTTYNTTIYHFSKFKIIFFVFYLQCRRTF